jgi:transcriptional regulator with XRE-family HTH domain
MTGPTLGERVADYRRQRGLSQRELAAEMQRSESWVSQVERDIQPVERLSVLHSLAQALGISVRDLRPEAVPEPEPDSAVPNDLDGLRRELSDVARAHAQRRQIGEAIAALVDAGQVSPEQVRSHHLARSTIRELLDQSGRRAPTELMELARRAGAIPEERSADVWSPSRRLTDLFRERCDIGMCPRTARR